MKSSFLFRSRVLFICIACLGLILFAKLFFIQVIHYSFYNDLANRQYSTPSSDIFERGSIYFTRKDGNLVSAAGQTTGFKLAVNPTKIVDAESVFQQISTLAPIDHDDFISKATKVKDIYEEVAHRLTKEEADAIATLKIPGLSIYKEKWRSYPGGSLASQSLGFVGYKGDELAGRYGLERQYNAELSRAKNNPYVNFFAEVFSNINKSIFEDGVREGDVVTSIEPTVQSLLEKELSQVKEKYQADSIGGIIMNPQDGSIYALSAKPDFDLNNFSQAKTSAFSNPLVENVLEFGSVVKPLIMAAGLDAGVVTADTKYNDTGSVVVEKKEIFNFDKKGRGPGTSMQEVLNQSLNTGMVLVEQKLGKDRMREYMLSYGIKNKTGIDLPNETSGLVSNLNSPREIEYANAAFGQGIALTPFEMIRALASLGNGGNLVVPHIVRKIKYNDGTEKEITYPTTRVKFSEATSEEITRMLVTVMDKSLKNGLAKIEHYSIAVKTGTAQVADSINGGYYEDRHTHSFFGYFPAYDPQFIVFLYAINPKGVPYASQTWADPFLNVTKFLLNYYQVPPDR
ncbi:MAG: penicillin-binding protein 2 [Candidatus Paceibacterota bacterium]|jgi:cell division protein FtsI/penicillin-binding protein 2